MRIDPHSLSGAILSAAAQPILPRDTAWVGVMLIIIAGIFLMALAVGLAVRFNAPDESPHAPGEPTPVHPHRDPDGDPS